jgi:hypothetical protein
MPKGFKFTQEDLDKMILDALNQPAPTQTGGAKPVAIQKLLAQAKLGQQPTQGTQQ